MGDRSSDEGEGASNLTEVSSRDTSTTPVPVRCNDNAKTVMKGKQVLFLHMDLLFHMRAKCRGNNLTYFLQEYKSSCSNLHKSV